MKEIKEGEIYRHFKGEYFIITNSELLNNSGKKMVSYKELKEGKEYVISIADFQRKVDKNKYPDATQEFVFELADENANLEGIYQDFPSLDEFIALGGNFQININDEKFTLNIINDFISVSGSKHQVHYLKHATVGGYEEAIAKLKEMIFESERENNSSGELESFIEKISMILKKEFKTEPWKFTKNKIINDMDNLTLDDIDMDEIADFVRKIAFDIYLGKEK